AHRPGPTEPTPRALKVPARQRRAHPTAADALAVEPHRAQHVHVEPQTRPGRSQHSRGRLALASEAKVVTDYDEPGAQLARQELRKGLSGEVTQSLAEAQQPQVIQAGARQDPPALAQRGEPRGRIIRRQVLARHGLERQQNRGRAALRRLLVHTCQQRLVAEVDAIVRADGQYTAASAPMCAAESSNELHDSLKPLMSKD